VTFSYIERSYLIPLIPFLFIPGTETDRQHQKALGELQGLLSWAEQCPVIAVADPLLADERQLHVKTGLILYDILEAGGSC
jgi:hypothetical protein